MNSIHTILVRNQSINLEISENGFAPSASSLLLAENFTVNPGEIVGDIGTGSGIQSIIAANCGAREVFATEINDYDFDVARRNIRLNGFERIIQVFKGSMLEPVPQDIVFDVVVFNLPQAPMPESGITHPKQLALYAGGDGSKLIVKAISAARARLRTGGRIYFPLDSLANPRRIENVLKDEGFEFRIIAFIKYPFRMFELELLPEYEKLKQEGRSEFFYEYRVPMYEKHLYECKRN